MINIKFIVTGMYVVSTPGESREIIVNVEDNPQLPRESFRVRKELSIYSFK